MGARKTTATKRMAKDKRSEITSLRRESMKVEDSKFESIRREDAYGFEEGVEEIPKAE